MSTAWLGAYEAAAVVIPACNERAKLPACLRAVLTAALCAPIPVTVVVVLDDCDDGSAELAGEYGPDVHFISVEAHNVGTARAVGFGYARSLVGDPDRCWYATTDADSRVDPDWLVHQLRARADMVLGVVRVTDWRHHGAEVVNRYLQSYQANPLYRRDQHDHIHGANMGFSARAYWRVGGFRTLASGEDSDLVERFEAAGYRVHRDTELSVITSARTQARAPHGFAHHLRQLGRSAAGDCA
ncbi:MULTISPECIES: glycosyltransferase family 2 protein [unclassified Mycobacterium]|uniref:glycosyltransferase n=1 Tax=unclassified Mycobacterium TaxID=2642494 RepID=UPI0007FC6587|nr:MULTISPECIES: glycosyltransferase family 2 protein [unclassified Mycobacterium]OBG67211.1 glycosyl transferase [Mycobacterium sp. E735]OBG68108.1 glycosyl transferase [Mycobacterium sp. E188]OBG68773.1 glycosyl transferase [Mycobacterium sp. E3305]OBG85098.1 glycosyl transferase [Mycobacterium sp. E3298]OBH19646.1 glycosyl transferase [Mycobacterium sp. E1715]